MTIGNTVTRILIAAIPVTAMLFIEVALPLLRKRLEQAMDRFGKEDFPQACSEDAEALRMPDEEEMPRTRSESRWRQDGRYYQILYQTAGIGNIASMDKLGELALVRKDFVEAFYWKLMVELHHGRPAGLSARGVCRTWKDAGYPESKAGGGGSFTKSQSRLAMAVLDLWSERHVHTPKEILRKMVEEGDRDALLYAKRFGIGHTRL